MDVKSLIGGRLLRSKYDLWLLVLYYCQLCLSAKKRENEIETGDGQMNRRSKGGGVWKLFRENTKTFLNVTFMMIPDSVDQMLAGMHL